MKLCKTTKWAMIGAVVLTFAMQSQSAQAACAVATVNGAFNAQDPENIQVCALIDNTFSTEVTDVDFGTIGATAFLGETGCLIMDPVVAGTINEDNLVPCGSPAVARIVSDDEAGTPGLIEILAGGAFNNQEMRMQFQVADPEMTCASGPSLFLSELLSDQTTPAEWENTGNVATDNTNAVIGAGDTDGTGALEIYIGATIMTDITNAARYESGACEGQFQVTLFY